jgi:hypothetical protein
MEPLNSLHAYYREHQKALHALLAQLSAQRVSGASGLNTRLLAAEGYGDFELYTNADSLCGLSEKLRTDAFCLLYELFAVDASQDASSLLLGMQGLPLFSNHEDHLAFIRYVFERKLKDWQERAGLRFERAGRVEVFALTGEITVQEKGGWAQVAIALKLDAEGQHTLSRQKQFSLDYRTFSGLFRTFEPFGAEAQSWVNSRVAKAEKKARKRSENSVAMLGLLGLLFFLFR